MIAASPQFIDKGLTHNFPLCVSPKNYTANKQGHLSYLNASRPELRY